MYDREKEQILFICATLEIYYIFQQPSHFFVLRLKVKVRADTQTSQEQIRIYQLITQTIDFVQERVILLSQDVAFFNVLPLSSGCKDVNVNFTLSFLPLDRLHDLCIFACLHA